MPAAGMPTRSLRQPSEAATLATPTAERAALRTALLACPPILSSALRSQVCKRVSVD